MIYIKRYKKIILISILVFFNILFIKKYQNMIEEYKGTNYLTFVSKYKCILFYDDEYKDKNFYRDIETGEIYFY